MTVSVHLVTVGLPTRLRPPEGGEVGGGDGRAAHRLGTDGPWASPGFAGPPSTRILSGPEMLHAHLLNT